MGEGGDLRSLALPQKALRQLASEFRLPFFQEGLHSFLGIGAGETQGEQVHLQGATTFQVHIGSPVNGLFGGMGGCAMIGQSLININSGGKGRLSGISAALFLLTFILFASSLIEMIPVAALVGVMFIVVVGTFEWATFRMFGKVPAADIFTTILVAVVTVLTDLAIAVLVGVIVSALVFAWEHAKQMQAKSFIDENGTKFYELSGPLFFGSVHAFHELFDPRNDPEDVVIDFYDSRVADHSGIEAIDTLAERYQRIGKTLHLKHLSEECKRLLDTAGDLVEVNRLEDPVYHVADDRLA